MDLGLSTGFLNRHSPEDIARMCRAAGIRSLELWDHDGYSAEASEMPSTMRQVFARHGLEVTSLHAPYEPTSRVEEASIDTYLDRFGACCKKARAYGASYVVVHPVLLDEVPAAEEILPSRMSRSISVWRREVQIARACGLRVAFENLPPSAAWPAGCLPRHVRDIARFSGDSSAGICLDVSHCFAAGEDPVEAARSLGKHLIAIHASDGIRGTRTDRHLPPGEGDLDWSTMFKALRDGGFGGKIVLEVRSPYLDAHFLRSIREFLYREDGRMGGE